MVFILYFIQILAQNGSKIPRNGQISTKMHRILFAAGALPQTSLWWLISPPHPLRYQWRKRREGKGRGKEKKGGAVALKPQSPEGP